jgi:hypothetical protein
MVAVIVAGFLAGTLGIWASILWGAGVLAGIVIYARQRHARTGTALDSHSPSD